MSIRTYVVGIGTGNPDHLTGEAIAALNEVDLFLVADKGPATAELTALRRQICARVIGHDRYRIVAVPDPARERGADDYLGAVHDWHIARAAAYAEVVRHELPPAGTLGFLVWGDPGLYDSTIRTARLLADHGLDVDLRVIPGISSVSLLAARHGIALNQVGGPVHITTGRNLAQEYRPELGDVVVMLDGSLTCAQLAEAHPDLTIFWGAQLGLPGERLVAGRLSEVIDEIRATRAQIRAADGWVMDTYLLRFESGHRVTGRADP